jgi:hypothetical protein
MQNGSPQARGPAGWDTPSGWDTSSGWAAPASAYRPLDRSAVLVQVLLAVFTLVTVASVASDWLELNLLGRLLHDPASVLEAEANASDSRQALLASLQLGAYLLTAIGFLVWFRRAYTNLRALGMEPLPYAAGWTIGGWLVPFLSLVRPKQIMDAIWRGSDPDRPRHDALWRRGSVPALVHLWWAVFLLSWLVDRVLVTLLRNGSGSIEALHDGSIATLASDGLDLLLAVLCFEMVRRATRRQQARAARLAVTPPA